MFILKGRFMENTQYVNKEGKTIRQAVIYSEGDGKTYRISDVNTSSFKQFDPVEIPVTVGCYDNQIYVKSLSK